MKKVIFFVFCFSATLLTNAQCSKLVDFAGTANGKNPYGDLIYDGTYFYGMTHGGGLSDSGTIFRIKPDGTGYNKLIDFSGVSTGTNPFGSLVSDGTFMYGMTLLGGASNNGVLFKIKPDGSSFSKLIDFNGTNGKGPRGSLMFDGIDLYGMTAKGGGNDSGLVFKIKPDGTGFTNLHNFSLSTGYLPQGSLISDGIFLYGMTYRGGNTTGSWGTVFKIKTDGTSFSKLLVMTGANGANPKGALYNDGTFLYGLTSSGGPAGEGTLFRIKPDGTSYSQLFTFDGGGGASGTGGDIPTGTLISDGNFLYGTTSQSCLLGCGTVFKIKPDGSQYAIVYDFCVDATPGINGIGPHGTLILNGGYLYGTANVGGVNDFGTIFKLGVSTGIFQNTKDASQISVFPNPSNGTIKFNIHISLNEPATLRIFDVTGKLKYTGTISGDASAPIDTGLESGIYLYQVLIDDIVVNTDKLIIIKD